MKFAFLAATLSVAMLLGCSHVPDSKRIPASVKDVGVVGPDGDIILFYGDGDFIIVKSCEPYTVLGLTPSQARANCKGKTNKVPVESFKQAIRNLVSTDRLKVLKPLTPAEVQAYVKKSDSAEIEAMVAELDRINTFITTYGAENANLVRRDELVKALGSSATRMSAIKKINTEIEKALNLITNQTKLTLTKFNSDKEQFLYTVLKNFDPSAKFPCGLKGSVDERISDCSLQLTSETRGFVLVTRTMDFKEVHKELSTGLLWGDLIPQKRTHYQAQKSCHADIAEVANLSGFSWRLPSRKEYEQALENGIREALPNMQYFFWTSTLYPDRESSNQAIQFDGGSGESHWVGRRDQYDGWIRCVAQ